MIATWSERCRTRRTLSLSEKRRDRRRAARYSNECRIVRAITFGSNHRKALEGGTSHQEAGTYLFVNHVVFESFVIIGTELSTPVLRVSSMVRCPSYRMPGCDAATARQCSKLS